MSSDDSLLELTIPEAQSLMESGDLTAVELTQYYLDRIAAYDQGGPKINSIVYLNANTLAEAAALDAEREKFGPRSRLHGIPIVVKDSFNMAGLPTTNGASALRTFVPTEDAFVVERLREAGAIILGKANMSTMAGELDGQSEAYGSTLNPYDFSKTPGGSSSGSAAAVAANFAMVSLGGETGGSIRVPADFNGVVGLKPSRGLISVDGTFPLRPERDVIGPFGRTVTDVVILMDTLVQTDPDDLWTPYTPDSSSSRPETYTAFLDEDALACQTIGLPIQYIGKGTSPATWPLQPDVQAAFDQAVAVLEAQGAEVIEIDLPSFSTWEQDTPEGEARWEALGFPDEFFDLNENFQAYYIDQFIQNSGDDEITSLLEVVDALPLSDDFDREAYDYLKELLETGQAKSFSDDPIYAEAFEAIDRWRKRDIENFMEQYDIDALAFPTVPHSAPEAGIKWGEAYDRYGSSLNGYIEGNWLGLPSISVPMDFTSEGVPMTSEFMGDYYNEAEIIGFAYDFEQATMYREPPSTTPDLPSETLIGTGLQVGVEGDLIDLRPQTDQTIEASFTVSSNASFSNVVGFYSLQDEEGTVIDPLTGTALTPSDAGYAAAAVRQSQADGMSFSVEDTTIEFNLQGGSVYAPFLIAKGKAEQVLNDIASDDPNIFLNFIAANPAGAEHIKLLGPNQFGFEDSVGGDFDYNDAVLRVNLQVL